MAISYSVVIPARNAERTIGIVLDVLAAVEPSPLEVIIADDGSDDRTAAIAAEHGVQVIRPSGRSAGGARNSGWSHATGDVVVFLDSDVIPASGWGKGLARALEEFPGAIIGCARTFVARTAWEWVAHMQIETPYLPRGQPRDVPFVSSLCMALPRALNLRWDESYGGEDVLFCAEARAKGHRIVFDPRFHAKHDHGRATFRDLRVQQRRLAYSLARVGRVQQEGLHKRIFSRVPLHYFALARLPLIYSRVRNDSELRSRFLALLPRLVIAEWMLGISATRYLVRRPSVRAG